MMVANRVKYNQVSLRWKKITQAQKADLITWFKSLGIVKPFFVVFDETNMDIVSMYVVIETDQISFNYMRNPLYSQAAMTLGEAK